MRSRWAFGDRVSVARGKARLPGARPVVNSGHDVKVATRGKAHHRVPIGPHLPSRLAKMPHQDRAEVEPSVGLQQPPRLPGERVQGLVQRGQRAGRVNETDSVVPRPGPQVPAIAQKIGQALSIFPETGTAVHNDPPR